MPVELRPYQDDFVALIRAAFARRRRVLAVAPTGSGKTICFAYITTHAAGKGNRTIVIVHRAEIVRQISRALDSFGVRHGLIMPGQPMTDDPTQVAMIATLGRRLDRVAEPALVIVDEAHHAITPTYASVFRAWTRAKILGVTATPQRLDGRGLIDCFDEMVIAPGTAALIQERWLSPFVYLAPPTDADFSKVSRRLGDYAIDELAAIMDRTTITGSVVGHYRDHLAPRPAIAFCITVAHAEHVAAAFNAAGYRAASVDGTMTPAERHDRLTGIGDGRLNVLTSCELISEGVDVPVVAGALLLRPTQSLAMFLQQIGRVLRPKPDGGPAVILDHVGNVRRHGLPDAVHPWTLAGKTKAERSPIATCEACFRVFESRPRWKLEAECKQPDQPEDCILLSQPSAAGREMPTEVDGQLQPYVQPALPAPPAWTGGIALDARGRDWFRLLECADTPEKLREIARARHYKPGWVRHILRSRDADRQPFEPTSAPALSTSRSPESYDDMLGA